MNDLERVVQVRNTLLSLRSLKEDVEMLASSMAQLEVVPPDMSRRKEEAERNLKTLRLRLPEEVCAAIKVADKLPRVERKVIYLYYVAGKSLNQVAQEMHYTKRTVQRMKAGALKKLREG